MKIKMRRRFLNNMATLPRASLLLTAIAALHLTACGNNDFTDLQQYITSIKAQKQKDVKPLPEFENIKPFLLKRENKLRDPFKPVEKIMAATVIEIESEEPDNGIHPDTHRVKEPLEAFALSGMKMVGTVNMSSTLWGLIKSDGTTIYRVKVGNFLGKNDGKITHIDKKKIELIEIIPSKPGRFVEQPTTLTLTK